MVVDGSEYECRVSGSRMDAVSGGKTNIRWTAFLA
jgi:hypothetical protein